MALTSVAALVGCSSSADDTSSSAERNTVAAATVEDTSLSPPNTVAATTEAADGSASLGTDAVADLAGVITETVGGRPFEINVPAGYDASIPVPLVVLLHGYSGSGASVKDYFRLESQARARGFLTTYPDGTPDTSGSRFWNATDACCMFSAGDTDDSGYLIALIDRITERFSVDPKRVFLVGYSNGGFMSYRMACDHADRIAAIVSLAGATFEDAASCTPSEPVGVLQVHGTSDTVISFTGGSILGDRYPAAEVTVSTWAAYNGCDTTPVVTGQARELDIDDALPGIDTGVSTFANCRPGGASQLWTIDGGTHGPQLSDDFATRIVDFLLGHPKP